MQVENPIKYVPSYDSKSKDTPLSSVPPAPYKESDETVGILCVLCLYMQYCCCAFLRAS